MLPRGPGSRLCIQRGFSRAAAPSCRAPLRQQIDRKISEECSKVAGFRGVREWNLCFRNSAIGLWLLKLGMEGANTCNLQASGQAFCKCKMETSFHKKTSEITRLLLSFFAKSQQHQAERKLFSNPQPSGQHHKHQLEAFFQSTAS